MKRPVIISTIATLVFLLICAIVLCRKSERNTPVAAKFEQKPRETAILGTIPTAKDSVDENLRSLEALGHVPENAKASEWQMAQKTSWWGKPLDATVFWSNRAIWWDRSAEREAEAHGRRFPPIPDNDPTLSAYSEKDIVLASGGAEGPSISFYGNDRESAYWDKFTKEHPRPPEMLDSALEDFSRRLLSARTLNGVPEKAIDNLRRSIKDGALAQGYPEELLTDHALLYAYVGWARKQYEKLLGLGWATDSVPVANLLRESAVDQSLITRPMSRELRRDADIDKIAYLRRLKGERTNALYIASYLTAWNLSTEEVFGAPDAP